MTDNSVHNARELARLLKVIADETRLRILGLLAAEPLVGKEIAARLDLTPPTVSHHMRKLIDAGIVTATSDAQMQRYALNTELLLNMRRAPVDASDAEIDVTEADNEEDAWRAKVLRTFFEGERLKSIPAKRKQRVVVLQHLLTRFDPARTYTELEVNDLLREAHDDIASLRRELVDYGFLTRERGIYQVARSAPHRSATVAQEIIGDERAWLGAIVQAAVAGQRRPDQ
jgi:biotin operon repressor